MNKIKGVKKAATKAAQKVATKNSPSCLVLDRICQGYNGGWHPTTLAYQEFYGHLLSIFNIVIGPKGPVSREAAALHRSLLLLLFAEVYGTKNCPITTKKGA